MPSEDLKSTVLDINSFRTLVTNELLRMKEFSSEALNYSYSYKIMEDIKNDYGFYDFENIEYEAIDWSDNDDE